MLLLTATNDKLQMTTDAATTVDVHASYVDVSGSTVTPGKTNTPFSSATTLDIVAAPASSTYRNVKTINIRNKHASDPVTVTVLNDVGGTDCELHKTTLLAGEVLQYIEGVGWYVLQLAPYLDRLLVLTADVTNATTSFADVTGLSYPVEAGKTYCIFANMLFQTNATTTGARFAFNGPAATYLRLAGIGTATVNAVTGVFSTQTASVSAYDTSVIGAQTTGPGTVDSLAIMSGVLVPSAAGTLVVRHQSEVAVASGLITRRGSWLRIMQAHNT